MLYLKFEVLSMQNRTKSIRFFLYKIMFHRNFALGNLIIYKKLCAISDPFLKILFLTRSNIDYIVIPKIFYRKSNKHQAFFQIEIGLTHR